MRILLLLSLLLGTGCSHAPETGRSQFIVMSSSQEIRLGQEAFAEILKEETKANNLVKSALKKLGYEL